MQRGSWPPRPTGQQHELSNSRWSNHGVTAVRSEGWAPPVPGEDAHQDVPDVLVGSMVAAEADAGPEQALPPPHVTGHHLQLTERGGFRAVHLHPHRSLRVGLQKLLQQVIFLILVNSKGEESNGRIKRQLYVNVLSGNLLFTTRTTFGQ